MDRFINVWVVMEISMPFNGLKVYFDQKNIPKEVWDNYSGKLKNGEVHKYVIRECFVIDSLDFCKEVTNEILSNISTVNISYDVDAGKIIGQNIEVS